MAAGYVRFGSKADIGSPLIDVRFTPKSGHCGARLDVTGAIAPLHRARTASSKINACHGLVFCCRKSN
jgi:hypothetical protein